jgi:hypothetical protein
MKVHNRNYIHAWHNKPGMSKIKHLNKWLIWTLIMPAINERQYIHKKEDLSNLSISKAITNRTVEI